MEMCQDNYSQKGVSARTKWTNDNTKTVETISRQEAVELFVLMSHPQKEWLLTTYTGRVGYRQRGR